MIEILRRDFREHHQMHVRITQNQFGTMEMMSQIAEQIVMDYPESPGCYRYKAQPVNDFLFHLEEEGSVENPITIEDDEGFSEPRTPVTESSRPTTAMEARPALCFIENLHNSSAGPRLFQL